jgi:hypothetical protein
MTRHLVGRPVEYYGERGLQLSTGRIVYRCLVDRVMTLLDAGHRITVAGDGDDVLIEPPVAPDVLQDLAEDVDDVCAILLELGGTEGRVH